MTASATAPYANTRSRYGTVAKAFHWTIALGIVVMIPLGIVATDLPAETSEDIQRKAFLFSIHKTLGVAIFFLALARIGWAVAQPKPAPAADGTPATLFLAALAHWLLYASLILVPLSGWIHHASTTGFAPIWWPFGQSLPFVPQDARIAETFAGLHIVFERILVFTLLLHVVGALKHHFWDKDDTLRRMLPGRTEAAAPRVTPYPHRAAPVASVAVLAAGVATGAALGLYYKPVAVAAVPDGSVLDTQPVADESDAFAWTVESGEIGITVRQLGSAVTGSFADWTARIVFDPEAEGPVLGSADVQIAIASLTLGTVTSQAMEPAFFDAQNHPTARFTADLTRDGQTGGLVADGTLTIKGNTVPMAIPFTLDISGADATATLSTTLDRRDYEIGLTQTDPGTLGFDVEVSIALEASRASGS